MLLGEAVFISSLIKEYNSSCPFDTDFCISYTRKKLPEFSTGFLPDYYFGSLLNTALMKINLLLTV